MLVKSLLFAYLFISVNDIILYSYKILWLKNIALVSLLLWYLFGSKNFHKIDALYVTLVFFGFVNYLFVAIVYGNDFDYIAIENIGVFVTFVVPVVVVKWIGDNQLKIIKIINVFLWAILFATLYKVIYVLSAHGYFIPELTKNFFKDIEGRGVLGGVQRLNTGNQLLVTFALFIAYRLFQLDYRPSFMIFVASICFLNIYLAGSRFFTLITFSTVVLLSFFNNSSGLKFKIMVSLLTLMLGLYLGEELIHAREAAGIVDDGGEYRIVQAKYLFDSFLSAPLLGHGPGYTIDSLHYSTPWAFENQSLVVFAKFGLLGFTLFAILICMQYKIFKQSKSPVHYAMCIFIIVFASIFNPYLFGTYAALAFMVSLIVGYIYDDRNRNFIKSCDNR